MRKRCENPRADNFRLYGARDIKVCERWQIFKNFLDDMGVRPAGKTLDRINNEGNYEPGNCRWATGTEQARNKRNTNFITYDGKRLCQTEWAQKRGIPRSTLLNRIKNGWPISRAISTPSGQRRGKCKNGHPMPLNGPSRHCKVCKKAYDASYRAMLAERSKS